MKELIGLHNSVSETQMQLLADAECQGNMHDLIERINDLFKSVSEGIPPLNEHCQFFMNQCEVPTNYHISIQDIERKLSKLKTNKSAGPDGIQV